MSSGSETSSLATTTLTAAARAGLARKSSVDIRINGHYRSKVYTSGSSISGEVVITPWQDARFDFVQIILLGTSRTRLDALQVPTQASHTFLKLTMPVPESAYPVPRVLEAGRPLSVPFHFVVPAHLTMSACSHHAVHDSIPEHHMRLPPSMGRLGGAADDGEQRDDLAPDMARVEYAVKVRVMRLAEPDDADPSRPVRLMEAHRLVRVLPASVEDPPLSLTKHDRAYCPAKTKSLRKNLFSGKTGRLTASAAQPAPVVLGSDGRSASPTTATVQLSFEPAGGAESTVPPPRISAVSAKLTATTYFSASPMTKLPNLGSGKYDFANAQTLSYSTSVALFSTAVEKVTWRRQVAAAARRDSGYASDSGAEEGEARAGAGADAARPLRGPKTRGAAVQYAAALAIPFRLPVAKKLFLPTFHSCLVSRVYILHLTLAVGGASGTGITLSLPLQVVVGEEAAEPGRRGLPSFDSVMALREEEEAADEHLRPRLLSVPEVEFARDGALPGYDELAGYRRPSARAG